MQTYCLDQSRMNTLNSFPLANAYIPRQQFTAPVSPEKGLTMGTVWEELYSPIKEEKK